MSMMGALEIQMFADVARLRQDMEQAKSVVKGAADAMHGSIGSLGKAFDMLGVGLSAAAFTGWIKGAINAADEASKLAQKTGIATDKIAGLTLAFQQSGAGGVDVLQKAMSKLATELVDGNKTLEAMGITTKNTREALGQIADKFANMAEGSTMAAAANDIFTSKLGANMIPLLRAGSKGLEEMDALARKLGITVDEETGKAAEQFNDTLDSLGMAMKGIATQASAQLLPGMNALAGAMLETFTEGGRLAAGVEVLQGVLKGLFYTAAIGIEVFNTLGKVLGGVLGAVTMTLQGDRDGASRVLREMAEDVKNGWVATGKVVGDVWAGAASEVASKSAEMAAQQRIAAQNAKDLADKLALQGEAAKKAAAELKKLRDAENDRLSRTNLAMLRRFDESSAEDARLTEVDKKAKQAELDIKAAQDLARQARVDAAETEADAKARADVEAMKKANDKILADWQSTVDQMGQSLADALMTGGKNLAGYLQGLFRTLVLRPVLMPAATAMSAAISGPAMAGGVGGIGNLAGLGGMLGSLGTAGTALGSGFGAGLGGGLAALEGGAGMLGGAIGAGSLTGAAGGAGLMAGAIAPYAAAAVAAYYIGKKLFGKKLDDTGITGTFSDAGFTGKSFEKYTRIIGNDSTKTKKLSSEVDAVFDAGALAARESIKSYVEVLGLPADAIKGFVQKIKFSVKGQSEKEIQDEIQRFIGKYAEGLAEVYKAPLTAFQKAGESLVDTLSRLATLQTFTNTLADMGGVFEKLAKQSVDARESFIELAGGMDTLGKNALQYVQDYYNRDEIAGIKAAEIKDALQAVGITQDVNSRDDFRRLVDGTDISTELGRQQLATLLNMAGAFTQVADYLTETGATLSSAAAQSPSTGATAALFAPGGQGEQIMAINGVAFWTEAVYNAVKQLTAVMHSGSTSGSSTATKQRAPEVNNGTPRLSWVSEATGG